jgi:branched-chain amino acid transport system permease protein
MFGLLIERIFFSRLVGESVFSMVMVTIGLLILIRGVVLLLFGPQVRPFPIIFPAAADHHRRHHHLALAALRRLADHRDRPGLVLVLQPHARRPDHDRGGRGPPGGHVAGHLGAALDRFAWVLGCVLSTLGAIVHLSGKSINILSSDIGLAALPVALLAGLESLAGLLLAGVIVGVVQGLASAYLDPMVGGAVGSCCPS